MEKLSNTPDDSEVDDDRLETHQTTVDQTAPFLESSRPRPPEFKCRRLDGFTVLSRAALPPVAASILSRLKP